MGVGLSSIDWGRLIYELVVFLFSLSFHEMAHAWAADRLGDSTARLQGRLTLNPMVHLDLLGSVILPAIAALTGLAVIGWAVPVPVDTRNLRHPRRDHALIAAAGPASNILLALVAAVLVHLTGGGVLLVPLLGLQTAEAVVSLLMMFVLLNLLLAVFNLIPVPPLDGSWMLSSFLPPNLARHYEALRPYGFILLLILVISPLWREMIFPVVYGAYGLLI
jgi:Zn-dependent protease